MYKKITVPLDGSELAECVLPHVEAIAKGCVPPPKVTLVRVVEPLHLHGGLESRFAPEERKHIEDDAANVAQSYLDQVVNRLKGKGVKAKSEVLRGNVIDTLLDYMNKNGVDLIIIASHGRSGISRWVWGSVTDRILRSSRVPVFMVRVPECVPGI
jgi:nucleotide-binding universal stress UspA family protein